MRNLNLNIFEIPTVFRQHGIGMERLLFPRCLVGHELPSGNSLGLTNLEIQQELDLATVPAKNLYKRSQTFDNFEQKINLIHKDFLKIVSEF